MAISEASSKLDPHPKGPPLDVKAGTDVADRITDDLYDMIVKSYAPVGGNATITSPYNVWDYDGAVVADVDEDPEPDYAIGYSYNNGRKVGYSATDGTPAAKNAMIVARRDLHADDMWGEVSDAPAHIMINKEKMRPIDDEETVRRLLAPRDIQWHGEHPDPEVRKRFPGTRGWYTRKIGGHPHVKTIVGRPKI